MIREHDIIRKISISEFLLKIEKLSKKDIEVTDHALFRVNEGKRKIKQSEFLKSVLLTEKPLEIWEQENKNLAILYAFEKNKILKIIIKFSSDKIYIVTFYYLNKGQRETIK